VLSPVILGLNNIYHLKLTDTVYHARAEPALNEAEGSAAEWAGIQNLGREVLLGVCSVENIVIPAKAGIHYFQKSCFSVRLDPRLRGGDIFVLSFRQSIRRSNQYLP